MEAPLDVETPAVFAMTRTMLPTTARPRSQPPGNARPLLFALGVMSIRMIAMIGTGLIAMPIASGRTSPIV